MSIEALIETAVEKAVKRVLGPHLHRIGRPDPVVYTVAQVAELLQVSEDTVGRMVKRGILPKLPDVGSKVLISRRAVDDLVNRAANVGADGEQWTTTRTKRISAA